MKLYQTRMGYDVGYLIERSECDPGIVRVEFQTQWGREYIFYYMDSAFEDFSEVDAAAPIRDEKITIVVPQGFDEFILFFRGFCRVDPQQVCRIWHKIENRHIFKDHEQILGNNAQKKDRLFSTLNYIAQKEKISEQVCRPRLDEPREGLSSGCLLHPAFAMAILLAGREHPCDRCNHDRSVCRGFPPRTPDPLQDLTP